VVSDKAMKSVLWFGCVYDVALGAAFALFGPWIFELVKVTEPNHWGYVQLLGGFVFVLGIMQGRAASGNIIRDLVWLSLAMKLVFACVVFYNLAFASIPLVWVWFAVVDALFAAIYFGWLAYRKA